MILYEGLRSGHRLYTVLMFIPLRANLFPENLLPAAVSVRSPSPVFAIILLY